MSQRNRATKRAGNAQVDHHEARYITKGAAATTKRAAKHEMNKARRALAKEDIREAVADPRPTAAQPEATPVNATGSDDPRLLEANASSSEATVASLRAALAEAVRERDEWRTVAETAHTRHAAASDRALAAEARSERLAGALRAMLEWDGADNSHIRAAARAALETQP